MRLYLNLMLGLLRRVLRSRDDLLMENLVLRQQLAVYAPAEAPALAGRRSALLVRGGASLGTLALAPPARAARDGDWLAPHSVAALLDLEESQPSAGTTTHRRRTPRADRAAGTREPPLGGGAHRR